MPVLHWSPRSPYVRKVMIALHEKGLADTVTIVRTAADPMVPHEGLMKINPLSKIPTLERENEPPLWDSRVIMEWADRVGTDGPCLFPSEPCAREMALRDEALGTGLMDIALSWLIEIYMRPEGNRYDKQIGAYRRKMASGLDWLEGNISEIATRPFDAGHISVGAALCYLKFRFAADVPIGTWPRIADWHDGFCDRPSVALTDFRDDPRPSD
jgi:glutathione S-transferase